jgi:transglutaminase-like putative cysteine protease
VNPGGKPEVLRADDQRWRLYLRPTPTIDYDSVEVQEFVAAHSQPDDSPEQRALALYYAVRDLVRYDPYTPSERPADFAASETLRRMRGWCVPKSILYAACCRALGLPARLGYADVRNHLSTENLRRQMGTDIFYWHGYTSVWLRGKWVKATPVFNIELCRRFRIQPLDFDGREDSIYHPYDLDGRRHMEYLHFRGEYADLPFGEMTRDFAKYYPNWHEPGADFDREVMQETAGGGRERG